MRAWICTALVLLSFTVARAEVYTWVDGDGVVHFGESPPAGQKRAKKIDLPENEAPPPPPPQEQTRSRGEGHQAARPALAPKAKRAPPKVEIYGTSWCPWCKKARAYFARHGISFADYDIEADAGAMKRKLEMDGDKSVPTVVVDGQVIRGYSPEAYASALGER